MRHRYSFAVTGALIVGSLWSSLALAEVRARTDRRGCYQSTEITVGLGRFAPRVWAVVGRGANADVLNPGGDANGDLWPTIGESTVSPRLPWVVWSRRHDGGYGLAWSRWRPGIGWDPAQWVDASAVAPPMLNNSVLTATPSTREADLDSRLAFDVGGRPYAVWWRRDARGVGTVMFSVFLSSTWMKPFTVSADGIDGRYPSIEIDGRGQIRVTYQTPDGWVSQAIVFRQPVTITDDINPLDHVRNDGAPVRIRN